MKKKIGFYMGSFDPIHIGHIATIMKVLQEGQVDEVMVVPAIANPAKKHAPADINQREVMIKAAILDMGDIGKNVFVSHGKGIADPDGKFYSYRQLSEIIELEPRLAETDNYIIAGTDTAKMIPKWRNSKQILSKFGIIEIERPGFSKDGDPENGIKCSSSRIREMIEDGNNPYPWIPISVWEVIKTYGLYG